MSIIFLFLYYKMVNEKAVGVCRWLGISFTQPPTSQKGVAEMTGKPSHSTLTLWAKTGDDQHWLSLHQHMRDSADVAGLLWDEWLSDDVKEMLLTQTGLTTGELRASVRWIAGAHDIGKATKNFQSQIENSPEHRWLVDKVREAGFNFDRLNQFGEEQERLPHSVYTQGIQQWWLENTYGWSRFSTIRIANIGGSHHGLPPNQQQIEAIQNIAQTHDQLWHAAWNELLDGITAYTNSEQVLREHPRLKLPVNVQMVLTGLVIMSDWIASNPELFPLAGPDNPLNGVEPADRLASAKDQLDLPRPWAPTHIQGNLESFYRQRFDWPDHFVPNQLQELAVKFAKTVIGPSLFIIEAPMGMGKTEAGLALADVIAQQLGIGGLMFATPTTATSDGLFGRTTVWAENTQEGGKITSMFLAHSRNALSDDFMKMRYRRLASREAEHESEHSLAISHDWFYGRKKGILSDIVIGTVDQVLQLALQTKHVMLKHLGFAGKIIIIDEVHSYDSYMQVYLQRAVQWLAAYGITVILLSATLPQSVRLEISKSYRIGLGEKVESDLEQTQLDLTYPMITQVDAAGTHKHPVPDDSTIKRIRLQEIDDSIETLIQQLEPLQDEGGCAVVICNTVDRAQRVYEQLKPLIDEDVSLLHARFTSIERKDKEQELLEKFGSKSHIGSGRPKRSVLVATQIVEQSLDLDFDLMVSDFCPTDLLLQRAGRLHRHQRTEDDRPAWLREPKIYIRGIEQSGDETQPPEFNKGYLPIYAEAILLASYALLMTKLRGEDFLDIPDEISALVQHTYQPETLIPDAWQERYQRAAAKLAEEMNNKQSKAEGFLLKDHRGRKNITAIMPSRNVEVKEQLAEIKAAAQVRDIDPTLEVLLVQKLTNGSYRLLPGQDNNDAEFFPDITPDDVYANQIALNSVRLPYHYSTPRAFDKALDQLEGSYFFEAWQQSRYLRGQLILPLDDNLEAELADRTLRYSSELGLQLLPKTTEHSQEDE